MKVFDPGHRYQLTTLDGDRAGAELRFVKRIGDAFPGNAAPGYEGVTAQEVLRALIDRTIYVDHQKPHGANKAVLHHLREALYELENRAAQERGEWSAFYEATIDHRMLSAFPDTTAPLLPIELLPVCDTCGHIACGRH